MYPFKLKKCGEECRLNGSLRSFLVMLIGFCAIHAVEAQTYNWKPVVVKGGGYVSGIITHPNAPGLMYCRTDVGGAYRWNPANDSWIPLLDYLGFANEDWSLNGIESFALDPTDTNRLYLACGWLGSGRPNAFLLSTNQGATFTRVNTSVVMGGNSDGRGNGERLAVDPNFNQLLLFGSRFNGLWRSTDYGMNWASLGSFPVTSTANGVGISFIQFIASSGTNGAATPTIYVGVCQAGTNNLYRSTNAGVAWHTIATGAATNLMPLQAVQDGLGNMYLTFCDAAGPNGASMGAVRKLSLTTLATTDITPPTGQGGFCGVSVDRQNPTTLVVSTLDRWWPGDEVYRSTNGGTSWKALYAGATIDAASAPWIKYRAATANNPHWISDIEIDPFNSNRVYHVSGGGIYSSYNLTAPTPSWQFRSDGLEETGLWGSAGSLCSPPTGPLLLSALGDIGGFCHYNLDQSPPETNSYTPAQGSSTSVDYAELSPNRMVRTFYNNTYGGWSADSGRTWTDFGSSIAEAGNNGPGIAAISADGTRLLWVPSGATPSYSTNNGTTWIPSTGVPAPQATWEVPAIASDRVNSNKFYLSALQTGVMYVSTNGGASFTAGGTAVPWADGIRTVFGYEGHLWVSGEDQWTSANNGLWRSTNSGASFTKLANVQSAKAVGFGKAAPGQGYPAIYLFGKVANTWGMYRSDNQGTNWVRITSDVLPYGNVLNVTGDQRTYGRCYAGPGGRGLIYGDIPNVAPATPDGLAAVSGNVQIVLTWNASAGATAYNVKRALVSGGAYTTIATVVSASTYTNTGLINGTTYFYVVSATNSFGESGDSVEASAAPTDTRAIYAFEGNAQDSSGSGNHGTGNALSYVAGKVGVQAAQFNGTSSYVSIPRSAQDDFTVAMWVKTTDTAGTAGAQWWNGKGLVDGEVNGGGADWGTAIVNGKFALGVGSSGGDTTLASSVNVNDGTWHHVAATRNNTSGATAVYVDGVLRGSGTGPTGSRTFPPSLRIGSLQTGNNFLNGTLDDVRLYDRILTVGEIGALIAPPAAPANLVAAIGDANVALSWSASTNATSYYVKRSTVSGAGFAMIATNSSLAFTNTGLVNGTLYYFVVSAFGAAGEGTNSLEVSARPTSLAPTQLGFTSAGNQLQFNWPADHTGWQLQAQTNAPGVGLGTNWATLSGSELTNFLTLPVDAANGSVFLRLISP